MTEYPVLSSPTTPAPKQTQIEDKEESDTEDIIDLYEIERQQACAKETGDPPNPSFIHAKINIKVTGKSFYLTLIYAFNDGKDRVELWRNLKYFAQSCNDPWALAGDFNTVLHLDERLGGQTKDEDMEAFVECVTECGMSDIQATGAFFTWTNKQDAEHRKYSRLDRFLVNNEWLTEFPDMIGHFHPEGLFDHNPCVISNKHHDATKNRSFKYFNMWGGAADFLPRVKSVWDEHIQDYYIGLLGSRKSTESVRSAVLDFGKCCNEEHLAILNRPVSYEEVKQDFFHTGQLLSQLNATNISLIPKCERPTSVKQFRPIACCNVLYKVISKLLCNRLALILPDIIHESQGEFVKGRSIIENVLICQDIVHQYSRKNVSPRCLFKIDLQKAYDTVEWDFVRQLLIGLKFPSKFVNLLMACITSTSYTLVLNGNNFGYFKGERGLRQGDPVSPSFLLSVWTT
ncbi:uncharacterized protein LOC141639662 [Silene latifolia]|uniref:uncharacterized protein LOC141639662 n=1 Tax=Silene latifolia TaxID=37657 RepID=UPI003D782F26